MKHTLVFRLVIISITTLLFVGGRAIAQSTAGDMPSGNFVFSSPKGMYVFCGFVSASKLHPVGDTIGYRIERKSGNESWNRIADISSVTTLDAYEAAVGKEHIQTLVKAKKFKNAEDLWQRIVDGAKTGKLPFISSREDFLALGILHRDQNVAKGTKYEYRVSVLLRSGATVKPKTSRPVEYGAPWGIGSMAVSSVQETDSSVMIEWTTLRKGLPASSARAFRRFTGDENFIEISTKGAAYMRKDSIVYTLLDEGLLPSQEYQYHIIPEDFYENTGPESELATIYTVNFTRLPLPQNKRAVPDTMGVRLSWTSARYEHVIATRIYRSLNADGPYERIAEVPATDTTYVDISATGMTQYYYKFSNLSYNNTESQLSTFIFGHFVSLLPPITPQGLRANPIKDGVELSWQKNPEPDIAGYYVVRAASEKDSLLPVSPLTTGTTFTDTSMTLLPYTIYRYAIIARNTSELKSHPSIEVLARPLMKTNPAPPRTPEARVQDFGISLIWDDPREYDPHVTGYVVYRGQQGTSEIEWSVLNRVEVDPDRVVYFDSSVVPGVQYFYAVSSLDILGAEGIRSRAVRAIIPIAVPPVPAGLHASTVDERVLLEWDDVEGDIASFIVYRNEAGMLPQQLATIPSSERTYMDTTVRKETVYYYSLSCINDRGIEGKKTEQVYAVVR